MAAAQGAQLFTHAHQAGRSSSSIILSMVMTEASTITLPSTGVILYVNRLCPQPFLENLCFALPVLFLTVAPHYTHMDTFNAQILLDHCTEMHQYENKRPREQVQRP